MSYTPRGSWRRIFGTVDLTAFASAPIAAAPGTVFGGVTYTSHFGAAANSIGMVNGQGLVINTKAGGTGIGNGSWNSPSVSVDLPEIYPAALGASFATRPLRFWFRVSTTAAQNFSQVASGVVQAAFPGTYLALVAMGHIGAPGAIETSVESSTAVERSLVVATGGTDDVVCVSWRPPPFVVDLATGVWAGDWPRTLNRRNTATGLFLGNASTHYLRGVPVGTQTRGFPWVFFTSAGGGGGADFVSTWTHWAVDEFIV